MSANGISMAARVMDEAIELAIEDRSPYPEQAAFIDAETPETGSEIMRAAKQGYAIVLVSGDGSSLILRSERVVPADPR
ncbi:MAG TPA: hypothetical protein VFK14_05040 [Solirubrobacterales bacterium]|nr:hypothetical protein [Solirubrobacterales bacterium]